MVAVCRVILSLFCSKIGGIHGLTLGLGFLNGLTLNNDNSGSLHGDFAGSNISVELGGEEAVNHDGVDPGEDANGGKDD